MLKIHVKKAGLQTLVQDGGRAGYQAFGVPLGGAMDRFSASLANMLLQNASDHPVLEITLLGPVLVFDSACQIALTGADLSPMINGKAIAMNETLNLESNAVLSFGRPKAGCRTYLAIKGDWVNAALLKSRSSFFQGNKNLQYNVLKTNDVIIINKTDPVPKRVFLLDSLQMLEKVPAIRALAGPEFESFSRYSLADFFSKTFTLSNDSNRMGYRIGPEIIDFKPQKELISSGILPGTIQISNSGQPIILMADAQTSGGYFRIANVISADMPKLAQLKPGDKIRFVLVQMEEARRAMEEQQLLLMFP